MLLAEERGGRGVQLDSGGLTLLVLGVKQTRWLAWATTAHVYVSARRLTREIDSEPDDGSLSPR